MALREDDLARAEALDQAATPGPWDVGLYAAIEGPNGDPVVETIPMEGLDDWEVTFPNADDRRYVLESRTGWPAATAEVRRLQAALAAIVAAHETYPVPDARAHREDPTYDFRYDQGIDEGLARARALAQAALDGRTSDERAD